MAVRSRHGFQDLSSAEFNEDFSFGCTTKLLTVYVHSTADITESVSVTFVSGESTLYNTLIEERVLQSESDYVYAAEGTVAVNEDDKINVTVTNANTTGVVYVTVKAEV